MKLKEKIHEYAREYCGFDVVGFANIQPSSHETTVRNWVKEGYHGGMSWYERSLDKRVNPEKLFDSAKTIIMVGVNYYPFDYPEDILNDPSRGIIARYAVYDDYHEILLPKLVQLKDFIEKEIRRPLEYKAYVDTGPILEREIAARAGLGFQGRNTTLINFEYGSWVLLAELIIDVETEPVIASEPGERGNLEITSSHEKNSPQPPLMQRGGEEGTAEIPSILAPSERSECLGKRGGPKDRGVLKGTCGTCTRCIDICPTKAILKPGVIDSNKCISYLTIEHKGVIPLEFRKLMKNRIYGCDICQEICPWNKSRQKVSKKKDFKAREDLFAPKLLDLFPMSQEQFSSRFKKSPIKRAKREGFLRNVLVAMGNWADPSLLPILEKSLQDESAVIRASGVWALQQIKSSSSARLLAQHKKREKEAIVIQEFSE